MSGSFYKLDGGDVSADGEHIQCPSCESATEMDLPSWDCEHCGESVVLFVGTRDVPITEFNEILELAAVDADLAELQDDLGELQEQIEETRTTYGTRLSRIANRLLPER